jgi:WD40 repeat protein
MVRLWDIKEGKQLLDLRLGGLVWSVAFSPDGKLLATGDHRGMLKVWKVGEMRAEGKGAFPPTSGARRSLP